MVRLTGRRDMTIAVYFSCFILFKANDLDTRERRLSGANLNENEVKHSYFLSQLYFFP